MSFSQEQIISTLEELIKIPTVSSNYEEIKRAYKYIESLLPENTFDILYIEKENVISQIITFKGVNYKKAKIVLNGHIDVIPADEADFIPRIEDGKMYGRGTADMKAGIVSLVFSLIRLAEEEKKLDCALIITSDEEVGGRNGVGYLVNELGISPEFVLVADGPRHDHLTITIKEKGVAWIEIISEGKAAHAARPWLGDNALNKLLLAIDTIRTVVGKDDIDEWMSTATLSKIETQNHSYNRIPEDARAVIDIRYTEDLANNPHELLEKIKQNVPSGVHVNLLVGAAILNTDATHKYIAILQEVMKEVASKTIPLGFGHAASDGRYFADKNIPTVLVGPLGANWHAPNEWVNIKSVHFLQESIYQFLLKIEGDIQVE
ncbi:MAG: hypothetical protein A3B90_00045 [Candidatus Magasanikbacteria bacterium RIFCSPHIGHO2_02_FULL_41_13]|uniref:Peptidase M20 dimerisation domain-containing protein n=1 Tax=Candidatus Magasanikbacteria bacterium RIFCSPHIGHO2_02_FULL_41_13 TaxID=1798676 RepID=A0A1F6M2N7_9BACT|nr:MAG: hypothetical protein A3B90_00045 [Candidatus Magasanikbacteria bacterium RIFCSPHIGHO2_02_FULL_41_13]